MKLGWCIVDIVGTMHGIKNKASNGSVSNRYELVWSTKTFLYHPKALFCQLYVRLETLNANKVSIDLHCSDLLQNGT